MQASLVINPRSSLSTKNHQVLSEDDPLFGVLQEDQVGINPLSGRPRIAPEVLHEMHTYLLATSKEDRHIREQRVIFSMKEAEENQVIQKSMLQLIPPQIFTTDLNNGKGIVFSFDKSINDFQTTNLNPQPPKLMASAIFAAHSLANSTANVFCRLFLPPSQASLSQISAIPFDGLSSFPMLKEKPKRNHGRYKRLPISQKKVPKGSVKHYTLVQNEESPNKKRKAEDDLDETFRSSKKKGHGSMEDVSLKKKT